MVVLLCLTTTNIKEITLSVFGFITRAVFGLEVTEKNGMVRISGIHAQQFIEDINKTFGTTRVTIHMLSKATRSYVEFHSFFLIDIEYIVRKLSQQRTTKLGKRGYIKMREALVQNTWLSGLTKIHPSIFNKSKLSEIKFDLLKHQSEFLDYYDRVIPKYNLRGILMAATPGSGKTISSIGIACAYESKNVIVVSPKNAVFRVWEKTLLEDMNVKQTVWVAASKKPMPSTRDCRWFIFHYESLGEAVALAGKLSNERCTVILDESHNLNEMKSLRTERFVNMCKSMKNSLIVELSGTPMKAMGAEAIPLISAIDPLFNDQCVEKFKKIYGKEAKAATEILANRLGIIMYKVTKEESKIEEPREHTLKVKVPDAEKYTLDTIKKDMTDFIKQRTTYYETNKKMFHDQYNVGLKEFELNGLPKLADKQQYLTYKTYIKEFMTRGYDPRSSGPKALFCNNFELKTILNSLSPNTKKSFKNSRSVVKYVDLKIRGECLGTVLSRARTNCNKSILDNLNLSELIDGAEKKTLIFTSYVEIVKATSDKLKAQGYSPLSVYAETNNNLPAMVKQFGDDEAINPMIATYQSLSTAVPLIMANRVILLNSPFRIHEKEQTVARANRIGQDKTVDVYNVLLDTGDTPNISTRSSDIMEWSREQVNAIMGFDNDMNSVSLEAYYEDDNELCNLDDKDYVLSMEDVDSECKVDVENQLNNSHLNKEKRVMISQVSLENQFNHLMNELNTIASYTNTVYHNFDNGLTMNPLALQIYSIVSPSVSNVGLETDKTDMMLSVISLEEQKSRTRTILKKLGDFLMAIFEAIMKYMNDSGRIFAANISKAKELQRYIKNGKSEAFSNTKGKVSVNSPTWLTRGNKVNAINHLRDYKWQLESTRKVVSVLSNDFKNLSKDFNKHLGDISEQPGLNQMTPIMTRLGVFSNLMIESSKSSSEQNISIRSAANMGGRQFILRFPKKGNSEDYVKNYSQFKLRDTVVDNFNINLDETVESLNLGQSIELLDMVIDNNKHLSYITSFILDVNNDVKRFHNKVKLIDKTSQEIDPRNLSILTAQASLMMSGLKAIAGFTRSYVKINDRASKASINYVHASAKGFIEEH